MPALKILLSFLVGLTIAGCTLPQQPSVRPVGPAAAPNAPFTLGIDVLASNGYDLLRGKRVGLICNQTSMTGNGTLTRVALRRAGVNLVALYAPEHGVDGTIKAGIHVQDRKDPVTGLTVYSLYGDTRKPTPRMLAPIDVMLFDLQDIGSRSYTYISTMVVAMEACGEGGKEFIVLDRPNPLGGWRVEGPPVEPQWKSFVSQVNVPYVHGMTTGELAMMVAGEGWITRRPRLRVVKMRGYDRNMLWQDTGLRWYRTSPNIPHAGSPLYYVATGMLGGAAAVDVGIGTENPFGYAGGRGVNPQVFVDYCRRLGFPGVGYEAYAREGFGGVKLRMDPRTPANITALDVYLIAGLQNQTRGAVLGRMSASQISLFNKVYGSDSLRRDLMRGVSPTRIVSSWKRFEDGFRAKRQRYLMY